MDDCESLSIVSAVSGLLAKLRRELFLFPVYRAVKILCHDYTPSIFLQTPFIEYVSASYYHPHPPVQAALLLYHTIHAVSFFSGKQP